MKLAKAIYSTRDLAGVLQLNVKSIRRMVKCKRITVHRVGIRGVLRFMRDDVREYLDSVCTLAKRKGNDSAEELSAMTSERNKLKHDLAHAKTSLKTIRKTVRSVSQ